MTYQNVLKQRLKDIRNRSILGQRDVEALVHSPDKSIDGASTEKHSSEDSPANDPIQVAHPIVKLSLRDVNPFKPLAQVLCRWNNIVILFASGKHQGTCKACTKMYVPTGLLFAFAYLIAYTSARTLGSKYNYSALKIGLVLLSFGTGR